MNKCINTKFNDEDSFTVFYITRKDYNTEDDYKEVFKEINDVLIRKYNIKFNGLYDVYIYKYPGIYVLDFIYVDDYGSRDFNVTVYLNSKVLYEFYDSDLCSGDKIYFDNKFYVGVDRVIDDIGLFEYGNIVYGEYADKIISKGKNIAS